MFSDGDFPSAAWDDISFAIDDPRSAPGPLTSTSSVTRQTTGGNPGAFRESTINWVFGDAIFSGGLNLNAVYDPSTQGAIESIDVSLDVFANLDPPVDEDGNPVSLAGAPTLGWQAFLEQGGIQFRSTIQQTSDISDWLTLPIIDLMAADFGSDQFPGSIPDFSSTGTSITFGYVLGHGSLPENQDTPPLTLVHGADNWSLTIRQAAVSVPEPTTLALFGIGALGMVGYAARRRRMVA